MLAFTSQTRSAVLESILQLMLVHTLSDKRLICICEDFILGVAGYSNLSKMIWTCVLSARRIEEEKVWCLQVLWFPNQQGQQHLAGQVLPKVPWNRVCIWPRFWVLSVPPNTKEGVHKCMTTFVQAFDASYLLILLKCTNSDCRLSFLSVTSSLGFPVFSTAMTCRKGFKPSLLVLINRSQQISSKHLFVWCRKKWDIVLGLGKPTFSRRRNQFLKYWKCFGVVKGSGVL